MAKAQYGSSFFVAGGTLSLNAAYVVRVADNQLIEAISAGDYCNILTPRQMGKSSLMIQTVNHLMRVGIRTAAIDLTKLGTQSVNAEQWYFGLISYLKQELNLKVDERHWWQEHSQESAVMRFSDFLREIILNQITGLVVIFVDEIDSTLSLPFTDDFFAAIRAAYNARASDPAYKRLTFVLLGVARPSDLIKDRSRTPYNIGRSIDLTDFSPEEAEALLPGLEEVFPNQARPILSRVLYWTGGHPYLTQRVCAAIVDEQDGSWNDSRVDNIVKRLFLSDGARKENNLQYINDRIRESSDLEAMLRVYKQVLTEKTVDDEERDPIKSQLKLTGLVKVTAQDTLTVRSRIYASVFNVAWIRTVMPRLTSRRITALAALITIVALIVTGIMLYRQQNSVEILAQTYTNGFTTTQSAVVEITNLAGLFSLGDKYVNDARNLFRSLDANKQVTMFSDLATPEQVGKELQTVIQGLYTQLDTTNQDTNLMQAMTEGLNKIESTFPDSRILRAELKSWIEGREQFQSGDYQNAVVSFSKAVSFNPRNPAVLLERAAAYVHLQQYTNALTDLTQVINIDPARTQEVVKSIQTNPVLLDYLQSHAGDFANLDSLLK
jgi:tetratricopeptide (TPR) repeat protein